MPMGILQTFCPRAIALTQKAGHRKKKTILTGKMEPHHQIIPHHHIKHFQNEIPMKTV
jgi:hypothetical protein